MNWPLIRLSELGEVTTGSTPRTSEARFFGGEIPFVTPAELNCDFPIVTTPRTLTEEGAAEARVLPKGAVMVCCIGSLGKTGIAGRSLATNQQINSVVFDSALVWPSYGFYACRLLKHKLESIAPATTLPIVSKSKFAELKIPVPPLTEQKRIASVLDQTATIQAKRRAALTQLGPLAQSLFLDLFGDPANNQERWPSCTLGDVLLAIRNGVNAEQRTEPDGWPITRIETISDGNIDPERVRWIEPDEALTAEFQLQTGDILFSHINSVEHIGKTALYEGQPTPLIHGINLLRLRPKLDVVDPVWLLHLLKNDAVRTVYRTRCKRAVNQASLNQQDIKSLAISLPPLPLQKDFAHRVRAVERLQKTHRASLAEMDALFAALQHRAFNGEL